MEASTRTGCPAVIGVAVRNDVPARVTGVAPGEGVGAATAAAGSRAGPPATSSAVSDLNSAVRIVSSPSTWPPTSG